MLFRQTANRSHLRGAPKTKMAWGPVLPKSVPGLNKIDKWIIKCFHT